MSKREDLISSKNARVASIVLEAGEASPWHHHTAVIEHIICLNGSIELQTNKPTTNTKLQLTKRYVISPMREHRLVNTGESNATYLLVQNGKYDFISSNS